MTALIWDRIPLLWSTLGEKTYFVCHLFNCCCLMRFLFVVVVFVFCLFVVVVGGGGGVSGG